MPSEVKYNFDSEALFATIDALVAKMAAPVALPGWLEPLSRWVHSIEKVDLYHETKLCFRLHLKPEGKGEAKNVQTLAEELFRKHLLPELDTDASIELIVK